MKLGSETGSLVNHLDSRAVIGAPEPVIGMGATLLGWTDRYPGTVIGWDGKILTVQKDNAVRTDSNGMSESQEYEYTPNPQGSVSRFKLDKNGMWREVTTSTKGRTVFCEGGGSGLMIGHREKYYDFSF